MRTGNPALNQFQALGARLGTQERADVMTIQGTITKTAILVGLLLAAATWAWHTLLPPLPAPGDAVNFVAFNKLVLYGVPIAGLLLYFAIVFKPNWGAILAPIYAMIEGVFLAFISWIFEAFYFRGIAFQAIIATSGVLAAMLILYRSGIIRATPTFKKIMFVALGGIFLVYMLSFVLSFFGIGIPLIHEGGPIGIGFSLLVIGIAALSLIWDFDMIEQGAQRGAPKYYEWFGGFVLLVTLIWIYLEILRLLAKLNRRD